MTEETENLVLQHLRAIRADIAKIKDDMATMRAEMTSVRQTQLATHTLQEHDHDDIASIKVRLDRIERRLDLVE